MVLRSASSSMEWIWNTAGLPETTFYAQSLSRSLRCTGMPHACQQKNPLRRTFPSCWHIKMASGARSGVNIQHSQTAAGSLYLSRTWQHWCFPCASCKRQISHNALELCYIGHCRKCKMTARSYPQPPAKPMVREPIDIGDRRGGQQQWHLANRTLSPRACHC